MCCGEFVQEYNSDPIVLKDKYGVCRGASRLGREGLTFQHLKEGDLKREVCFGCHKMALCVPNGLCISCQVKKPVFSHYYVKKGTKIRKCRSRARQNLIACGLYPVGTVLACSPMLAYTSTKNNEMEAILRRVCMPTPPIDSDLQIGFSDWFKNLINSVVSLRPFVFEMWTMLDVQNWSREYGSRESEELQRVWVFVLDHLNKFGCIPDLGTEDKMVIAFLKWEKDNGFDSSGPVQKAPRLIQGFSRILKILTACVVTQVQAWFHDVVGQIFPGCRYSAGDNIDKLNSWYMEHQHEGICGVDDFTSYDSLCDVKHHEMALDFYAILGCPTWFLDLRRGQISPIGQTRHGIEFEVPGTMRSGAADTSLWNTVLSLAAHTYCSTLLGGKMSIVAMGDDCLFFSSKDWNYDKLGDLLENLGFLCKLTWGLEPWERVYLNMLPYPVENGVCFGPLVGRMLSRIGWSTERRSDPFEYLGQIGEAFLGPCNHIPVIRKFFSNLSELRLLAKRAKSNIIFGDFKYSPFLQWKAGRLLKCQSFEMSDDCVNFLCCRYGVNPRDMMDFESFIGNSTKRPSIIHNNMCQIVVDIDC